MKTFLVAGGDMRSVSLARTLSENDMVSAIGFDGKIFDNTDIISINKASELPERVDCLVLPLPVSTNGVTLNCPLCGCSPTIRELSACVKEGGVVFGGNIPCEIHKYFEEQSFAVYDYLDREELAVMNALPVARFLLPIVMFALPASDHFHGIHGRGCRADSHQRNRRNHLRSADTCHRHGTHRQGADKDTHCNGRKGHSCGTEILRPGMG